MGHISERLSVSGPGLETMRNTRMTKITLVVCIKPPLTTRVVESRGSE